MYMFIYRERDVAALLAYATVGEGCGSWIAVFAVEFSARNKDVVSGRLEVAEVILGLDGARVE